MRFSRMSVAVVVCALALPLGACGNKKDVKLAGERVDITLQPTLLQPTPTAGEEAFAIAEVSATENWGQTGGNAAHAPDNVALPQGVVRAWTYNMGGGAGAGAALLNPPVVHSGRLFAVNTKREVVALNASTGKELWSITLPNKKKAENALTGGLAVMGNLVFITTGEGKVYALTANSGKQVWVADLAVPLRGAPTVEGERVFVISHDNRVFGLNALDGTMVWTHSGMEESLSILVGTSPATASGILVVPYSSGELYAIRATDGRYIWHDTLTSPFTGQDPESTVRAIAAAPVMADGLVYAVGLNGGLSAYGAANGQRYWKVDILTSQMPVVSGLQIYALTEKGELAALNRKDGSIRWVTELNTILPEKAKGGKRLWSGPTLAGNRLIVVSSDGYALSVNPQNGKRVAATNLDEPVSLPPIVTKDGLYFLADSGKIIAFRKDK